MIPWAIPSPLSKQHRDRFSRFRTCDRIVSLYFTMGRPFPQIAHSYGGSGTPSNISYLGPIQAHNPNGISISLAFCTEIDLRASVPILYTGTPLPPSKLPLPMGDLDPTQILNPNRISIGSAVFAGLTTVTDRSTDRQTDRPRYSVSNSRPRIRTYVRAMWSKTFVNVS